MNLKPRDSTEATTGECHLCLVQSHAQSTASFFSTLFRPSQSGKTQYFRLCYPQTGELLHQKVLYICNQLYNDLDTSNGEPTKAVLGAKVDTTHVIVEFVPFQNHGLGELPETCLTSAAAYASGLMDISVGRLVNSMFSFEVVGPYLCGLLPYGAKSAPMAYIPTDRLVLARRVNS